MNEVDDRQLECLLSGHLSRQLEGRTGLAEGWLADRAHARRRSAAAWATAAVAGIAACVVIAVLAGRGDAPPPPSVSGNTPVASDQPVVQWQVDLQTVDVGAIAIDDLAAHEYRRQMLQRLRWYDPQRQATFEATIPREEIFLIENRTY